MTWIKLGGLFELFLRINPAKTKPFEFFIVKVNSIEDSLAIIIGDEITGIIGYVSMLVSEYSYSIIALKLELNEENSIDGKSEEDIIVYAFVISVLSAI